MDKKLIITINREYGSGGRTIGKKLAKELNLPYYDENIIKMASEESAVAEQFFRLNDEKPGNKLLYKVMGGLRNSLAKPSIGEKITSPDNLFRFQSEVIRELAKNQSGIFIGRCSDYVLESAGFEDFISIFVYADLPTKMRRVMDVDVVDTKEALKRVQKIDKKRQLYYSYYTGEIWQDMNHYDLPVNTTKIDLDQAVTLIKEYIKLRGYNI